MRKAFVEKEAIEVGFSGVVDLHVGRPFLERGADFRREAGGRPGEFVGAIGGDAAGVEAVAGGAVPGVAREIGLGGVGSAHETDYKAREDLLWVI